MAMVCEQKLPSDSQEHMAALRIGQRHIKDGKGALQNSNRNIGNVGHF